MGNQFSDFDNKDCAWTKIKNKNKSLVSKSIFFFLLTFTTELSVINIDICSPSALYYFTFMIDDIWFLIWFDSSKTGAALNKIGMLWSPFWTAYCNKLMTAVLLPKLMVGSYVWFWSIIELTFDVKHDINW